MREINKIIIHCSATKSTQDIGAYQIDEWHKKNGWSGIGYHYVIRRNGRIENGRPLEIAGAHCKGQNKNSIGICLVGGIDADGNPQNNFTEKQFQTLRNLAAKLKKEYPNATVHGHNEFANKACPCFNVRAFFAKQGAKWAL